MLQILDRAGERGKVKHAINWTCQLQRFANIVFEVLERRSAQQVRDIFEVAGDQIIDSDNLVILSD
jgi:hypothetical protein